MVNRLMERICLNPNNESFYKKMIHHSLLRWMISIRLGFDSLQSF